MKAILRLKGKIRPEKKLSVVSYQPSAKGNQQSELDCWLPAKLWLIPKTYYLISKKERSAISSRQSEMSRHIRAIGKLIPKAQYLIPLLFLVFVSCGAALAQEPVGHTAPAAQAETKVNIKNSEIARRFLVHNFGQLNFFMIILFFISIGVKGQETGHKIKPYTAERGLKSVMDNPEYDLERFPFVTYEIDNSKISGLKIGDRIPDHLWDMPLWVVNHPDGRDTTTLREYEDEKLLILDFWAKWCGPCVESMDKWNRYEQQANGEVKVIGVHLDYDFKALPFIIKKRWGSLGAIGLNAYVLNRHFFDRDVISRMAWIKDGRLLAITSVRGYNFETVQKVLNNEPVTIPIDSNWTYFNTNTLNQ